MVEFLSVDILLAKSRRNQPSRVATQLTEDPGPVALRRRTPPAPQMRARATRPWGPQQKQVTR